MQEQLFKDMENLFDSIIDEIEHPENAGKAPNPFAEEGLSGGVGITGAVSVIIVKVSPDKMRATAMVASHTKTHKPFTPADILKAAEEQGVVFGIDSSAVLDMASRQLLNTERVIARGVPPVMGIEGRNLPVFDCSGGKEICNIEKGTVLCRITPPTTGRNGMDVCGGEIKARGGRPAPDVKGENTELSADGRTLIARETGTLVMRNGQYSIVNELVFRDGLSGADGVIVFPGTVVVYGNVAAKATIRAGGAVIYGKVSGAAIEAKGDITVNGDVIDSLISSERGSVKGNNFLGSMINAGRSVIGLSFSECRTKCVESMVCTEGAGIISGGVTECMGQIYCLTAGSRQRKETFFRLGDSAGQQLERAAFMKQLNRVKDEVVKIDERVSRLEEAGKTGELSLEDQDFMRAAVRIRAQKVQEEEPLRRKLEELDYVIELSKKSCLHASTVIYSGVVLYISGYTYVMENDKTKASAYANNMGIVIT